MEKSTNTPRELEEELNFRSELRRLRTDKGLTQQDLADLMVKEGWTDYTQATVSRMEKGQRPVTLAESRTIARIFGTHVGSMIMPSAQLSDLREFKVAADNFNDALVKIDRDIADFDNKRAALLRNLKNVEQLSPEEVNSSIPEDQIFLYNQLIAWAKSVKDKTYSKAVDRYYEMIDDEFARTKGYANYASLLEDYPNPKDIDDIDNAAERYLEFDD